MRDPRDEPNPHYCKECGSTIYDKEWGLQHYYSSCELSDKIDVPKPLVSTIKPSEVSPEIANDFFCYHSSK